MDAEKKIVDSIVDFYTKSKNAIEEKNTKWKRWRELYWGNLPDDLLPNTEKSSLVPPQLYKAVQDWKALAWRGLFSDKRIIRTEVGIGGDVDGALAAEVVVNYLMTQTDFKWEFHRILDNIAKYGMGIGISVEEDVPIKSVEFSPMLDENGMEIIDPSTGKPIGSRKIVKYSKRMLVFKAIEPFMYYPDVFATTAKERRSELFHRFIPIQELRDAGVYTGLEKLKDSDFPRSSAADLGYNENDIAAATRMEGDNFLVDVKEYAQKVKKGLELTTIANNKTIIREPIINPFADDDFFSDIVVANPSYIDIGGIGAIEFIEDLFYELYLKRNQRIDNINFSMLGLLLGYLGDDVPDYIEAEPYSMIKVLDPERIRQFPVGQNTGENFAESSKIEMEIKEVTNTYDYSVGQQPRHKETATGVMALVSGGEAGFKIQLDTIGYSIQKIAEKYWRYAQLKLNDDELVRILGNKAVDFPQYQSILDIKGMYKFKYIRSNIQSEGVLRQQAMALYNQLMGNPFTDKRSLAVDLLRTFDKMNIEEIVPDPKVNEVWANEENTIMLQGMALPPIAPNEPHNDHLRVHQQVFLQLEQNYQQSGDEALLPILQNLSAHIEEHRKYTMPKRINRGVGTPSNIMKSSELANSINNKIQEPTNIKGNYAKD